MSHIIQETLNAIWKALKDKYVSPPKSATDWKNISRDFESVWHLPHCIGAIDGKHIAMQCPKKSGSLYFNYKGWFSIVLMAVCDASYNFTLVDIGQYGSPNDSSVLNNSEMGKAFEDGSMSLPQPEHLPGCGLPQLPFYLVGDEIFALKPWLLQPYPGKNIREEESIFNYRLSRARRVIENCFGILVARWRIFCRAIEAKVETVQAIVQAAICLHNYLRQTDTASYCLLTSYFVDSFDDSGNTLPGEWHRITSADEDSSALRNLPAARGTRYRNYALDVSEALKAYVNSDQGAVPCQWDYICKRGPIHEP